jgi:hypothetical protein
VPLEKVPVNRHRLDAAPPPPVAEHDVEAASGKNFKKLQRLMAERLMEGERPSAAMKPCVNGTAAEVVGEPGGGDANRIGRQL